MSVQTMTWALKQQHITDATARYVLLCLANYAGPDGRGAFPSAGTLANDTGLSERTIRAKLDLLEQQGMIVRGNQAIAAAYIDRADRRPVCYDIVIQRGEADAPRRERGANDAPNGVQLMQERGAGAAPNPSINHQEENRSPVVPAGDAGAGELELTNGQPGDQLRSNPIEVIRATYNCMLGSRPGCVASMATTPLLERKLRKADANARKTCKAAGVIFEPAEFWEIYFGVCLDDPWMRGDRPNPNNLRWKQSLPTLIDDERFEQIMNTALAAMEVSA